MRIIEKKIEQFKIVLNLLALLGEILFFTSTTPPPHHHQHSPPHWLNSKNETILF